MMVTGSHGVRMQYDYTHDRPGLAGDVSAASPRWLRLTRSGDTITGYDSADGTHWTKVDAVTLAGLPATAQIGLFAASPVHTKVVSQSVTSQTGTGGPTQITAAIDKLDLQGAKPGGVWAGGQTGGDGGSVYPVRGGAFRQSGGTLTVTGSGDIAPAVPGGPTSGVSLSDTLVGVFAGLIAMVVVGTVFITSEYRRGLIRTTLTASPRRGRVLAAKAVVIAAVTFVAGLVAVTGALVIGERQMRAGGVSIDPVSTLTLVRIVAGTAALLAVAAVLALAIGTVLRRSAIAVVAVIVAIVLPYFLAVGGVSFLPAGVANWLLRLTPAAAFAIQQPYPRYAQVAFSYTPSNGYYPLAPWAGFAVLCAWAAVALGLAAFLLRRRDA
jgi:ABC-type transport system involved in multi-copper enzyme maturation permease subunit